MTPENNNTQMALLGKDISQIQKDLTSVAADVKSIKENRYVTMNEVKLEIKAAGDIVKNEILGLVNGVSEKVSATNKILWLILSTFAIAVIGAIAKSVLKI